MHAIRFALRVIHNGDFSEEGESPLANEWLKQSGLQPEWGQASPFSGRGGLRMVKRRISEVQKRHEHTRQELERAVSDVEALLATPEITFEPQSVTA